MELIICCQYYLHETIIQIIWKTTNDDFITAPCSCVFRLYFLMMYNEKNNANVGCTFFFIINITTFTKIHVLLKTKHQKKFFRETYKISNIKKWNYISHTTPHSPLPFHCNTHIRFTRFHFSSLSKHESQCIQII